MSKEKGIIENTKELFFGEVEKRFSNPLLGAFLISWCAWNWEFLYILLFINEQYVSLTPDTGGSFSSKYEYLDKKGLLNLYDSVLWPFLSSIGFVILIEWGSTALNLFIKHVKEKYIESRKPANIEDFNNLKEDLVQTKLKYIDSRDLQNDEILKLQNKNDDLENNIEEKVTERVKEEEEKNLRRIKELENKRDSTLKLANDRLQENNFLANKNSQLDQTLESLKSRDQNYKNEISELIKEKNISLNAFNNIQKENISLKNKIEENNKPIDKSIEEDYNVFKKSENFKSFGTLIDKIEENPFNLNEYFYGKHLKYLTIKGIISEGQHDDGDNFHYFTQKGDKFVEYYLDENYKSTGEKPNNNEGLSIEDLPF